MADPGRTWRSSHLEFWYLASECCSSQQHENQIASILVRGNSLNPCSAFLPRGQHSWQRKWRQDNNIMKRLLIWIHTLTPFSASTNHSRPTGLLSLWLTGMFLFSIWVSSLLCFLSWHQMMRGDSAYSTRRGFYSNPTWRLGTRRKRSVLSKFHKNTAQLKKSTL